MRVYFVRHGESEGNVIDVVQTPQTPLSDIGIDQARMVAYRFKRISIETIIASDYKRTQQTAEEISKVAQKEIVFSPLLREYKQASCLMGKHYKDPELIKIRKQMKKHEDDPGWHYQDEENYFDFVKRGKQALKMLAKREEHSIAVVTHGLLLSLMGALVLFDDHLSPEILNDFRKFHISNTGITIMDYEDDTWSLKTWNDHAHLG